MTSHTLFTAAPCFCLPFLQGLLTNDVTPFLSEAPPEPAPFPSPNQPAARFPPIYSALLSPQGRMLFDLFLYRPPNKVRRKQTESHVW